MQIKPITALTVREVIDLATHAAERGERISDANPFPRGTPRRGLFTRVFTQRAAELASALTPSLNSANKS